MGKLKLAIFVLLSLFATQAQAWTRAHLYDGSVMHSPVKPPRGARATICFGGGCAGQTRVNFSRFSGAIRRVFGSPSTPAEERAAISRTVDHIYRSLKPLLVPRHDAVDDEAVMIQGFQHQGWECKTHAQNVTAVVGQIQRLGLLRWYSVGPHGYSSGHFFGTLIAKNGVHWQLDTFFGATIFSRSPSCVRGMAVCIKRLT